MSGPVGADARGVTLFIAAGESAGRQDSGPLQPILVTSLSIEGTDLLCWTTGVPRWEALAGRLQVMHALIDAIPRYVWLDHGYDPGPPGTGEPETMLPA